MLGDDLATLLARTAYHEDAVGFGAEGILVESAGEVGAALHRAREAARRGCPVLINVWLDRTDSRDGSLSILRPRPSRSLLVDTATGVRHALTP
jgi:acetolactate synthase-1/2/3 large subunit